MNKNINQLEIKTNKSNIIIIILIVVIFALGAYIIYDKLVSKMFNNKESVTTNEKIETQNIDNKDNVKDDNVNDDNVNSDKIVQLDINSSLVLSLMDMLKIDDTNWDVSGYFFTENKIDSSNLNNQIKLILGYQSNVKNVIINGNISDDEEISLKTINSLKMKTAIQRIFGQNITYFNEDITLSPCYASKYDKNTDSYIPTLEGCGGTLLPSYSSQIYKAEQTSDLIKIYNYALYILPSTSKVNVYKTDKKTLLGTVNYDDSLSNLFSEGDSYIFTFKQNSDGTYYWLSSEMID